MKKSELKQTIMKKSELKQIIKEEIQNVLSNYPKFDRNQFREFKNNLETIIWNKYPLNKDIKSKIPNNLIQVSPDNIETDWARIDYKIIKKRYENE